MTIGRPITVKALLLGHELVDVLTFSLPKTEVIVGTRGKTLEHWVEAEGLDGGIVGILEEANTFSGPNNDVAIGTTGGPSLSVLGVGQAVDNVSMGALGVDHLARLTIVDHNAVADGNQNLLSVYIVERKFRDLNI